MSGPDEAAAETPQLVPLLAHLARISRRRAEIVSESDCTVLNPRHAITLEVLRDRGPLGQSELAKSLKLDPTNVVGLLNELESARMLVRRRDPTDRRRHIVELSPVGANSLEVSSRRYREIEDELFAALTAAERRSVHRLLTRVAADSEPTRCRAEDEQLAP